MKTDRYTNTSKSPFSLDQNLDKGCKESLYGGVICTYSRKVVTITTAIKFPINQDERISLNCLVYITENKKVQLVLCKQRIKKFHYFLCMLKSKESLYRLVYKLISCVC